MFSDSSLEFIEAYGSINFSASMLEYTKNYYFRVKAKNQSDYCYNTYKRIKKTTSKIEDRFLNMPISINWLTHNKYIKILKNNDLPVNIIYGFEPNEERMNLQYWQEKYDSYHAYLKKHGTKPDSIFSIPKSYFNYFYQKYGDSVNHFKEYVKDDSLSLKYYFV